MKLRLTSFLAIVGGLLFSACGNDPEPKTGRLKLDPYEFVVEGDSAATMKLIISCDREWHVSPDNDWITISPDRGSGNSEVTVTIAQNNDADGEERTGEIMVSSGQKRARATITQGKRVNIIVMNKTGTESDNIDVGDYIMGDETYFSVKSDLAFTIESNATWFTFSPHSGAAGANTRITTNAVANPQTSTREAKLFIKTATRTKEVTIRQNYNSQQDSFFGYSDAMNSVSLSDRGGARFLRWFSRSSVSWTVTASAPWLHVDMTSGTGQKMLKVSADPNTTGGVRTGTLTFNSVPAGKTQVVTVSQNWDSNAHSVDPNLSITTSSDYWQDGEVLVFKKHTIGKGVPVVIVGDGFDREDLRKGGWWENWATHLAENFKRNEVICDMLDYFDVLILTSESEERGVNYDPYPTTRTKFGAHNAWDEDQDRVMNAARNAVKQMYTQWGIINTSGGHTAADIMSVSGTCSWGPAGLPDNHHWGADGSGLVRVMFMANGPYSGNAQNPMCRMGIDEPDFDYWAIHEFTGHTLCDIPDMYWSGCGLNSAQNVLDLMVTLRSKHHPRGFSWHIDSTPNDPTTPLQPAQAIWKDFYGKPGYTQGTANGYELDIVGTYATTWSGNFCNYLWGPSSESCMRGHRLDMDLGLRLQLRNTILLRAGDPGGEYARFVQYIASGTHVAGDGLDEFMTWDRNRTRGFPYKGAYTDPAAKKRSWSKYSATLLQKTAEGDYDRFWHLLWPRINQ
ncbi:MAG: BACON domain-containing protein [Rikenellaceae bacterium]|jgi:hypothetical protein|nr:BACON domain-containing protein [Rikenellaceae bacterium]